MARLRVFLILLLSLLGPSSALAVEPDEVLSNPALESRARALSQELRCLVCQNQSIDDSNAPLARDLRILLRERLESGDSDQQVMNFLVARYGEFVLLRPPIAWHTALLWLTPMILLLTGGIGLLLVARRKAGATPRDRLTPAEDAQIAKVLDEVAR